MLNEKAVLVNLKISQWTGRKFDKRATSTVVTTHNTDVQAGNYSKKLLPGAKELDAIQNTSANIRSFFYQQTLPWCNEGSRILASSNYLGFTNAIRTHKSEFETAVKEFIKKYPELKDMAKTKLGDLFNDYEYPDVATLQNSFGCEVSYMPVPTVGDFRVELTPEEKQNFEKQIKLAETQALNDVWQRLNSVVSKAVDKLKSPDAVFRDSLIENIQDLCNLLPRLNVTENENVEKMRQDVQKIVDSISAEDCRKIPEVRSHAAERLDEAMKRMSGFIS
jgi:hypothetical protein